MRAQARKIATAELSHVDQAMFLEGQSVDGSDAEVLLAERIDELIGSRRLWSPTPHADS